MLFILGLKLEEKRKIAFWVPTSVLAWSFSWNTDYNPDLISGLKFEMAQVEWTFTLGIIQQNREKEAILSQGSSNLWFPYVKTFNTTTHLSESYYRNPGSICC